MIASSGIPVLDMAANTGQLGRMVAKGITPTIAAYGLAIPEFYIENISLPDEVEAMLDKRTSMGIVGDLERFGQYARAEAMLNASRNTSGGAGAGLGAGLGAAIGIGMGAQHGPWGQLPIPNTTPQQQHASALPPPLPSSHGETLWHIALNGEADGPFGKGYIGRLVRDGQFQRGTLVWTAGQDGWKQAEDVPELAQLFTIAPPPLPK